MGLLDYGLDPRTQGLLSAAFQGLQASGPSRMPVSLGQIIGQGGATGLNEYQRAIKEQRAQAQAQQLIELEKQRAELTKAQIDKMRAETTMLSGLGGLDMNNPDQLESAASKLMMVSPDKANSLMIRAKDLRAVQQEDQTLKALRPTQGLISDVPTQGVVGGVPATRFNVPPGDQMVQPPGATEPIPASVVGMGKTPFVANPTQTSQLIPSPLMGGLLSSQAPGVAQSAGGLTQMMANPAFRQKSSLVESQIEKLRNADTMAQERSIAREEGRQTRLDVVDAIAANRPPPVPPAPSVHTVQDKDSPTGWSHKDFRTGALTVGAPPPASSNVDRRMSNVRGNQILREFDIQTRPIQESLNAVTKYNEVRATGDFAQASKVAEDILVRAVRGGSSRLKSDVSGLTAGAGGGNIVSQIQNWTAREFTRGGGPTKETMAKLDKIINATAEADLANLANSYKRQAGKVAGVKGLTVKETLGSPYIVGTSVVFPDGTLAKFADSEKAANAAQVWMDNN